MPKVGSILRSNQIQVALADAPGEGLRECRCLLEGSRHHTMAMVLSKLTVLFDRTIGRRFYRIHAVVYRWTGGLIGHRTPAGPVLLLTTVGRRSGQRRTTPLLYMPDGSRYVVVGSNGGRDQPPAWVLNLSATMTAEIQVGRTTWKADAHILTGEEVAVMWPRLFDFYKGWSHYQQLTEREMKVVSFLPRVAGTR